MNGTQRGGQQNPPYLQMRRPVAPGQAQTRPVVTPQPMAPGDTVSRPTPPITPAGQASAPPTPAPVANGSMPPITPAGTTTPNPTAAAPASPPQAGGNSLGDLYGFLKSDLQNQTKQATSNSIADASARGVYYGTPLTGSEADINTQYLRGLGQLDAGMYGNEQQNQLARLGMATNLSAQGGANAPPPSQPMDWSGLGALFGSSPGSPAAPGQPPRQGPVVTPAPNAQKPATPPYGGYGM